MTATLSLSGTYRYWPVSGARHSCAPLSGPAAPTVTITLLPVYAPSHWVCVGPLRPLAPQVLNTQGPRVPRCKGEDKVEFLSRPGDLEMGEPRKGRSLKLT